MDISDQLDQQGEEERRSGDVQGRDDQPDSTVRDQRPTVVTSNSTAHTLHG